MTITMDGVSYHVRLPYPGLTRSFNLIEGVNRGTALSQRKIRDLKGTGYTYSLSVEPDPLYPAEYDAFYLAISAPVDTHEITLPFGQGSITYDAQVASGSDGYYGMEAGVQRWRGLKITFAYIAPQVTDE